MSVTQEFPEPRIEMAVTPRQNDVHRRGSGTCLALLRSETRAAAVSKDDNGGEGSELRLAIYDMGALELHR